MEQTQILLGKLPPHIALDLMVDTHGPWTTIRALIATLLRRRPQRPMAGHLNNHLRRDIGLREQTAPPPRLQGPVM